MRDWGLFEWGMTVLLLVGFGLPLYAIGFAIHSRSLDYECTHVCYEQRHVFSRINTAGECVCGDAAE